MSDEQDYQDYLDYQEYQKQSKGDNSVREYAKRAIGQPSSYQPTPLDTQLEKDALSSGMGAGQEAAGKGLVTLAKGAKYLSDASGLSKFVAPVGEALGNAATKIGQFAERRAITSLNGNPEETGAMLKGVGNANRDSVGRTLLKNKILGRLGLATDNSVAENLQRTSDTLGEQQSEMVKKLGTRSASMDQIKENVLSKMDVPYSVEGQKANAYVNKQLSTLPKNDMGLQELTDVKKQWQGLSDYPKAGAPTPQDVSNATAMKDATGGIRKTIGDIAPELNPQLRSESNIFQARESMRTRPDLLSTHGSSMLATGVRATKSYGNQVAAVGSEQISQLLKTNPQALGRFAPVLTQALMRSPESLKASMHVLQMSDPEFRQMIKGNEAE